MPRSLPCFVGQAGESDDRNDQSEITRENRQDDQQRAEAEAHEVILVQGGREIKMEGGRFNESGRLKPGWEAG